MTFDRELFGLDTEYPCKDWWDSPTAREERKRYAEKAFPRRADGRREGSFGAIERRREDGPDKGANDYEEKTQATETEVD